MKSFVSLHFYTFGLQQLVMSSCNISEAGETHTPNHEVPQHSRHRVQMKLRTHHKVEGEDLSELCENKNSDLLRASDSNSRLTSLAPSYSNITCAMPINYQPEGEGGKLEKKNTHTAGVGPTVVWVVGQCNPYHRGRRQISMTSATKNASSYVGGRHPPTPKDQKDFTKTSGHLWETANQPYYRGGESFKCRSLCCGWDCWHC